jgi:hypothetical protein
LIPAVITNVFFPHFSSSGWDHAVQGLVQLGFLLMDACGPRLVFGKPETEIAGQLSPNQTARELGSKMLLKVFKSHEIVRSDILSQIFNRVMTETSAPVYHYLSMFMFTHFVCNVCV